MTPMEKKLLVFARAAARNAYVPYSKFPVGAVLLTQKGKMFSGCNIANASFPLGICAERVAIFNAVSAGHKNLKTIAVSCVKGKKKAPSTLMPCGACLQVMTEFFQPEATVIVDGVGNFKLSKLLPLPFKYKNR